jgi:CheY-like chemotaxis protein
MARLDPIAKSTDPVSAQALRVLVIETNEADRQNIVLHLGAAWPFERELLVEFADDGQSALQKLAAARFSLIVLDWKTPEMLGGELLRTIREGGARTPAVILSDLRRHEILDDIEALGTAFINRAELNSSSLREAIASSLRMLGRVNLTDTTSILPKNSSQSLQHQTRPSAQ